MYKIIKSTVTPDFYVNFEVPKELMHKVEIIEKETQRDIADVLTEIAINHIINYKEE